jgi:hypothetical protein
MLRRVLATVSIAVFLAGLVAVASARPMPLSSSTPSPTATPEPTPPGQLHHCPPAGKWAISVWSGPKAGTGEALDTCGAGAIDAAYYIHPLTQAWRVFFRDQPAISDLNTLDDLQAVATIGSDVASPTSSPEPTPTPGPSPGRMAGCPLAGKWALSVWNGPNATEAADAFATCTEVVGVAYWLDPQTQTWQRYVHERPDLTTLLHLDNLQGVFALGSTEPKEYCAINIPGTYHGAVTIDGQPAPVGTEIKVFRGGVEFGSTTVSEEGIYTVNVPTSAPVIPPCFESTGGPLTFTCDGAEAREKPSWGAALRPQDLTCVRLLSCPAAGKWSITVYSGAGESSADALGQCAVSVDAAYWVDPATQDWKRYIRGRPELTNLASLEHLQGVLALGSASELSELSSAAAAPPAQGQPETQMEGCPQPGLWAISVWNGPGGTSPSDALATCSSVRVAAAYWIDPRTQVWKRHFDGRPDISNLPDLREFQGLLTLGGEAR